MFQFPASLLEPKITNTLLNIPYEKQLIKFKKNLLVSFLKPADSYLAHISMLSPKYLHAVASMLSKNFVFEPSPSLRKLL